MGALLMMFHVLEEDRKSREEEEENCRARINTPPFPLYRYNPDGLSTSTSFSALSTSTHL